MLFAIWLDDANTQFKMFYMKKYQNSSTIKLFPPPIIKLETNNTIEEKPLSDKNDNRKFIEIVHEKKVSDVDKQFLKERAVTQLKILSAKNITVTKGEAELCGKQRFLAEGFVKESECSKLIQLAEVAGVLGDGYNGKTSPHTSYEKFEGVTLGRAAMMVYFGLVEPEILELYLNISEYGRDYVERYFNLKKKLYFSFTHLVCRTALSNSHNISYMSHSVHADNCNLMKNGNCPREVPAYFWRDFSAIIYLNSDFEGGDFIFVSDSEGKSIQSSVMPSCGRLVAFSAGKENLHGVKGVRRGKRCSLGLWFTFNETYNELERVLAKQVLQQVKENGDISYQLFEELKRHTDSEIPSDSSEAKTFSLKL